MYFLPDTNMNVIKTLMIVDLEKSSSVILSTMFWLAGKIYSHLSPQRLCSYEMFTSLVQMLTYLNVSGRICWTNMNNIR